MIETSRVSSAVKEGESAMNRCKPGIVIGRRRFLAGAGVAAAGAAATQLRVKPAKTAAAAGVDYPPTKLPHGRDLKIDEPLEVAYPDAEAPGVLVKFGKRVPTGVGSDGDIVGFSTICPHKGFPLNYVSSDRTLNCPGHYSRFDCEAGGLRIWGPATQHIP